VEKMRGYGEMVLIYEEKLLRSSESCFGNGYRRGRILKVLE